MGDGGPDLNRLLLLSSNTNFYDLSLDRVEVLSLQHTSEREQK